MPRDTLSTYGDESERFALDPATIHYYKSTDVIWSKLLHFVKFIPCLRTNDDKCEKMMDILKQIILFAEDQLLYINMYYDDEKDELKVELISNLCICLSNEIYDLLHDAVKVFDHNNDDNILSLSFPVYQIEEL